MASTQITDDQFGGRTDDDLFADDFEPVDTSLPAENHQEQPPVTVPAPVEPEPVNHEPASTQPELNSHTAAVPVPRTLAHSRHAPQQSHQPQPRPRRSSPKQTTSSTAPPSAPTGPAKPGGNTALPNRLASGANPRTKPSEAEVTQMMAKMQIKNADAVRRFNKANKDQEIHNRALEKDQEAQRQRRAEEDAKRRHAEAERKKMDDERAANRARKLRAINDREGSGTTWGHDQSDEAESGRLASSFRGAHGGVKGTRTIMGIGIAGSRFANMPDDDEDTGHQEFAADEFRGRGRGGRRGGRGANRGGREGRGGRGGRGGRNFDGDRDSDRGARPTFAAKNGVAQQQKEPQQPPKAEDFPALPGTAQKNGDASSKPSEPVPLIPLSPVDARPIGRWADEVDN